MSKLIFLEKKIRKTHKSVVCWIISVCGKGLNPFIYQKCILRVSWSIDTSITVQYHHKNYHEISMHWWYLPSSSIHEIAYCLTKYMLLECAFFICPNMAIDYVCAGIPIIHRHCIVLLLVSICYLRFIFKAFYIYFPLLFEVFYWMCFKPLSIC